MYKIKYVICCNIRICADKVIKVYRKTTHYTLRQTQRIRTKFKNRFKLILFFVARMHLVMCGTFMCGCVHTKCVWRETHFFFLADDCAVCAGSTCAIEINNYMCDIRVRSRKDRESCIHRCRRAAPRRRVVQYKKHICLW